VTSLDNLRPEIEKIDQIMRRDLEVIENDLLARVIEYAIFNGGKRIRPMLTVLAAGLCGVAPSEDLYRLALTFEYLHAASLLHDDVIDHAKKRRGQTAANEVWSNTHVILAGDFLHGRAMRLAGILGGENCLDVICQAVAAMVESEFLQLQNAERQELSEDYYFKVLQGKTAALIAAACETGGIFANGSAAMRGALAKFGANLGLSFQIADDLLDYLGDPDKTGKAVGNDFQEGKMTLPLLYTLRQKNSKESDMLSELLASTPAARNASFEQARDLIAATGGFAYAGQRAKDLIREALHGLAIFPDCPSKEILTNLAAYVLERKK
jgi:octaprenyl-diphosphate synthase